MPLGIAFILSVLVYWYSRKRITTPEWQWGLWLLVPSLPVVVYGILTMLNNEIVAGWLSQRGNEIPSVPMLLIGLGLPLLIAIPVWYGHSVVLKPMVTALCCCGYYP